MKILIVQTAFPGDLFLSAPLLKETRSFFPEAKIFLMCREKLGSLFLREGLVNELVEIKKNSASSYKQALLRMKKENVDVVICPHRSLRTALFVKRLGVGLAVGYKRWWNGLFFHRRMTYPSELPDALRQQKLLTLVSEEFDKKWNQEMGGADFKGSKMMPVVDFRGEKLPSWTSGSLRSAAQKPFSRIICVAPGSVWATKKWPSVYFSEVVERLLKDQYEVVLVGASADREDCDEVHRRNPAAKNLCGKTSLEELYDLFRSADLLISNDSGAMHVASVASLPVVALFGPTVPEFGFRPWQSSSKILQIQLNCRPCSAHGSQKCPIGTHACMKDLSVDLVYQQVMELYSSV